MNHLKPNLLRIIEEYTLEIVHDRIIISALCYHLSYLGDYMYNIIVFRKIQELRHKIVKKIIKSEEFKEVVEEFDITDINLSYTEILNFIRLVDFL